MTKEELTKEINNLEKERVEINKKIDNLTKELNNLISSDPIVKVDVKDIIYDGVKTCLLDFNSEKEITFSKLKEIVLRKNEILIRNVKYLDSSLISKIISLGKEVDNLVNDVIDRFYFSELILIFKLKNRSYLDKIYDNSPLDIDDLFKYHKDFLITGEEINTVEEYKKYISDNNKNVLCTNQYCSLSQTVSKIEEYLLNKESEIFNFKMYSRLEV